MQNTFLAQHFIKHLHAEFMRIFKIMHVDMHLQTLILHFSMYSILNIF